MRLLIARDYFRGFFVFWFMALIFHAAGVSAAASGEIMQVRFAVESCAVLDLVNPEVEFAPVQPGQIVNAVVQALIRANVPWELRVKGTKSALNGEGAPVEVASQIQVCDHLGSWENIEMIASRVVVNQPPTESQGQVVDIALRLQGDFGDPPGTYVMEIEFTLVPLL